MYTILPIFNENSLKKNTQRKLKCSHWSSGKNQQDGSYGIRATVGTGKGVGTDKTVGTGRPFLLKSSGPTNSQ